MIPCIDRDVVKADEHKPMVHRANRLLVALRGSLSSELQGQGSVLARHVQLNKLRSH